jgi:hypothetical protein
VEAIKPKNTNGFRVTNMCVFFQKKKKADKNGTLLEDLLPHQILGANVKLH